MRFFSIPPPIAVLLDKYGGRRAATERFNPQRAGSSKKVEDARADTASPRLEKIAALTRSIVGRTPRFGTARRTPPALPAITLMATRLDLASQWLQAALPPAANRATASGIRTVNGLLFLFRPVLFSAEEAVEHAADIPADDLLH